MSKRHAGQDGFTLLELLAALVIVSLLTVGLAVALRDGVAAWNRQSRLIQSFAELDAVDRLFRHLLNGIDIEQNDALRGSPHEFTISSRLPEALGPSWRRANITLIVSPTHQLILQWTAADQPIPAGGQPTIYRAPVLDGVEGIDLAYFQADGEKGWQSTWQGGNIPDMVRLQVHFPRGDERHWPDIIANSMIASQNR